MRGGFVYGRHAYKAAADQPQQGGKKATLRAVKLEAGGLGNAEIGPDGPAACRKIRGRLIDHRAAYNQAEPVADILEVDSLVAPHFFERVNGPAPRLSVALLQFMDGTLGEADMLRQLSLTPAEYGTRNADFCCESPPLKADQIDEMMRLLGRQTHDC
jgi:hypothetical protein